MPLIVLSIIVQLALVVHIIKTGRNTSWVFIVLFFPLVGTLAYLIIEILPELTQTRTARTARRSLAKAVDPDKELREATDRYGVAATADNALALASQYLKRERYAEARALYAGALGGVHEDDPDLLLGLARAEFGLDDFAAAIVTLDKLKARNPGHTSQDGHLLYARALEGAGRMDEAVHEYEALIGYCSGPEPVCRYATLLKRRGENERARALFDGVLARSRTAGRHYNTIYKDWVALAAREVRG